MTDPKPDRATVPDVPPYLSPEDIKNWIRAICDALEITPTELARRAQIAQTTLNRFLSGKSINKNLSGSTLASLTAVIRRAEEDGAVLIDKSVYTAYEKDLPEGIARIRGAYNFINISRRGYYIGKMHIEGHVGKGIGLSANYMPDRKFVLTVPLTDPMYNMELKGFELREEGNLKFRQGTILACVPEKVWALAWHGASFESGFHCILFETKEANTIEGAIYRCEIGLNSNWWLVPTWADATASAQIFVGTDFWAGAISLFPGRLMMIVASVTPEL